MIFPAQFDLAALRGAFAEEFGIWDQAIELNDTKQARRARRSIQEIACAVLARHPATLGGFYLFADLTRAVDLSGLNYVGIADTPRRPIGRRIVDRMKDDSSLDVNLDHKDVETARRIITGRLLCALPHSGGNYVEKHLRVATLFRRSPTVLLLGCERSPSLIRDAEALLISSAVSAGAPVLNVHHRHLRRTVSRVAFDLAHQVVAAAGTVGLPPKAVNCWHSALDRAVIRSA